MDILSELATALGKTASELAIGLGKAAGDLGKAAGDAASGLSHGLGSTSSSPAAWNFARSAEEARRRGWPGPMTPVR